MESMGSWRRGWDSNPRCPSQGTTVFETVGVFPWKPMKSVILVGFQPVMRQVHTEDTADEHLRGGYKSGHRVEPFRLRSSVLSLRARARSSDSRSSCPGF